MSWKKWTLLAVIAVIALPFGCIGWRDYRNASLLKKELQLAKQEGIPTNHTDFEALIEAAEPEENAAPIYARLTGPYKLTSKVPSFRVVDLTDATYAEWQEVVDTEKEALNLIDQAVLKPRCWFNRDWSLGAGVLMPEYVGMKAAARLLTIQGSLDAHRGRHDQAILEVDKIFRIADHARQEPHEIAWLVADAIDIVAMDSLATWSLLYREPTYTKALQHAVDHLPRPDVRRELAGRLWQTLGVIELTSTNEGLADLGMKKEDVPTIHSFAPLMFDQGRARIEMVRAHRRYWALLDDPIPNEKDLNDAKSEFMGAMIAFPTAYDIYWKLTGTEDGRDYAVSRIHSYDRRKASYEALLRALKQPRIPATVDTSDLLSPYDGKPLEYQFDGKQIKIKVSGWTHDLVVPRSPTTN